MFVLILVFIGILSSTAAYSSTEILYARLCKAISRRSLWRFGSRGNSLPNSSSSTDSIYARSGPHFGLGAFSFLVSSP